jgi:hypothetical protein
MQETRCPMANCKKARNLYHPPSRSVQGKLGETQQFKATRKKQTAAYTSSYRKQSTV